MAFKSGFVLGFGAGYVLGTRAGKQRYEQLRSLFNRLSGSPTVQRAVERTQDIAGEQGKRALSVVQQGVEKAGGAVKERLSKDSGRDELHTDPWRGSPVPDTAEGQLP